VVAVLTDGTIRWLRAADGIELLSLFIHEDCERWIVWTPEGFYDASVGADSFLGWQVNRSDDRSPDFFPASQLRERYYRRDVIERVLDKLDVDEAVREANALLGPELPRAAPIGALLSPVVQIYEPVAGDQFKTDVAVTYSVQLPADQQFERIEARIDGAPVAGVDTELLNTIDRRAGILRFTMPRRDVSLSVIAYGVNGRPSEPATVRLAWRGPGEDARLNLYILTVGISEYRHESVRLRFAAKDAEDFQKAIQKQKGGLYEEVILHRETPLSNEDATRIAIINGLDWIANATNNSNDVAMVFLAGHGIRTPDQHYRFLPHDYDPDHVRATTISDLELCDALRQIGGKKLFFFDTCYAGSVLRSGTRSVHSYPDIDKFANELKAAENGVVVFASSRGNQLSLESENWQNGAFTKALVECLNGETVLSTDDVVRITDLEKYLGKRVRELTSERQHPQTAKPGTIDDFPILSIARS
jgi:hypothetical protein